MREGIEMTAFDQAWAVVKHDALHPIGSDCPKCAEVGRTDPLGKPGKIVWRGSNKHRDDHSRCNYGCVIPARDPEPEPEEEKE